MRKVLFAIAVAVLSCSSAQAQNFRQDRYEANFARCVENQVSGARVSRREMRNIREECRHRAAARTERQSRRAAQERQVYVPQPMRQVRPLERY
jgi:hypothetical protein